MKKLAESVRTVEMIIAGIALTGIVGMIALQVVFRFVLNSPLTWAEELGRYLHIWLVLVGAAALESNRSHIRVEFFSDRLFRGWARTVLGFATDAIAFITGAALLFAVLKGLEKLYNVSTPAMGMPMTLFYVPTVLGALGLCFHAAINAVQDGLRREQ